MVPPLNLSTPVCHAIPAEAVSLKDMLGLEKQLRDRNSMLVSEMQCGHRPGRDSLPGVEHAQGLETPGKNRGQQHRR